MSIRFGIELEFIGPGCWYLGRVLHRHAVKIGTTYDSWTLSHDSSVMHDRKTSNDLAGPCGFSGSECCELRTPIMDPDSPAHLKEIQRVLEILSYLDCHPTKSSGMHVHISSSNSQDRVDAVRLSAALEAKFRKFVFNLRSNYCAAGVSWSKDRAVRVLQDEDAGVNSYDPTGRLVAPTVGNHIEVRIFNSTLDFGKIQRRLKDAVKMYRECMIDTSAPAPAPAPATTGRSRRPSSIPAPAVETVSIPAPAVETVSIPAHAPNTLETLVSSSACNCSGCISLRELAASRR